MDEYAPKPAFRRHLFQRWAYPHIDSWLIACDEGSRALADRGWVCMTIPAEYGGRGRSHLERIAVTKELFAARTAFEPTRTAESRSVE
ncbi:acyl-CoA dehydrogenase family protein [Rhodococcus sp. NPDC019627]|uniref:acyl-CoA dehydrogenase family protein n=1 Tax=unclassified Rhodococcus (in: high G+C Gram-positive bacteria) TaxID=192944 RepID=UPI0033FC99D9